VTGRWFSPGTPFFCTNKTDRHDVTQILLKVALDTINQNQTCTFFFVHEYQHFAFSFCRVFPQLIGYSTVWPGWSNGYLGADLLVILWMCSLMRHFSSHWLLLSYAYKITLLVLSSGGEWMIVDYRQISNFSAISWREQVNFQWDDDEVRFVLDHHAYNWIFIVLAHWNNSTRIGMSLHSDILSWFRANKSVLINTACLAGRQQIQIVPSLVWSDRGPIPRSSTLGMSTLNITPPMRWH
jgi:hypothetical protein